MSIAQFGGPRSFEDVKVAGNSHFEGGRPPGRITPPVTAFISRALHAASNLQRQGIVITAETLHNEDNGLPVSKMHELLATRRWDAAVEEQGLANTTRRLSAEQTAALAIYMDMTTTRSHSQKLKAIGVTNAQWTGWLRQPAFAEHLSDLSNELLQSSVPLARQRIAEGVDKGDKSFIDLALKMTGNDPDQNVDIQKILLGILAIVDEEVQDAALLARIGERVKTIMGGGLGDSMKRQIVTLRPSEPSNYPTSPVAHPGPTSFPIEEPR